MISASGTKADIASRQQSLVQLEALKTQYQTEIARMRSEIARLKPAGGVGGLISSLTGSGAGPGGAGVGSSVVGLLTNPAVLIGGLAAAGYFLLRKKKGGS